MGLSSQWEIHSFIAYQGDSGEDIPGIIQLASHWLMLIEFRISFPGLHDEEFFDEYGWIVLLLLSSVRV